MKWRTQIKSNCFPTPSFYFHFLPRRMTSHSFYFCSLALSRTARQLTYSTQKSRFRALFGTSPLICSILWRQLQGLIHKKASPINLLWTLHFSKCYNTSPLNQIFSGAEEKTYNKWVWHILKAARYLQIVGK